MKLCPSCKTKNTDEAMFCFNCGTDLRSGIVCMGCGFVNKNDSQYCGNCGKPIEQKKEIEPETVSNDELKLSESVENNKSLPEKIVVGFNPEQVPFYLDVKGNGNILINTDSNGLSSKEVSEFISKLCLKLYDSFPLGAVRVIFFVGDVDDVYFSKFRFGSEQDSYEPAKIIKENYSTVDKYLENKCEELLYGKLSGNIKDFYNLYEIDSTEHLDYIVIRNGFKEIISGRNNSLMTKINSAFDIKNNSAHHRCGIRYIIVNDSEDIGATEKLRANSDLVIEYRNNNFYIDNSQFNSLICPSENIEDFIEKKCQAIGVELDKTAKKIIHCEDIGFGKDVSINPKSTTINIPVGKSGAEITEIPFSCSDTDGTFAEKNIGLMVLGRSRSGKSSLYNSIIINGSYKYSPDYLNFWLLDFKSNAAAGIYSNSPVNIPHIKLVAPNSKVSDGYSILKNLCDEMNRRYIQFGMFEGQGQKISNLVEYNEIMENQKQKKLPRIILMIDEAQEMFRDDLDNGFSNDYPKDIANLVNNLVAKGAAAGIHLALFAQNLDFGKTYLLKDGFISQLQYKICFRLGSSSVANSGFESSFNERKDEIAALNTGVMYLPIRNEKLEKSKVAFIDNNEFQKYFSEIANRYSNYQPEILKIGLTEKLNFNSKIALQNKTYLLEILDVYDNNGKITCCLGEDSYKLRPVRITFSSAVSTSSTVFVIGNSSSISTSILTSLILALRKFELVICDGTPRVNQTPFKSIVKDMVNVKKYSVEVIDECIRSVYKEYLNRIDQYQNDPDFIAKPIFLFLNDFETQGQITNNVTLRQSGGNSGNERMASILGTPKISSESQNTNAFTVDIRIKNAIGELMDEGHKYNIFLVATLKDTYIREFDKAIGSSPNVILFNDFRYPMNSMDYKLKTSLHDIKPKSALSSITMDDFENQEESDMESFALLKKNNECQKFRPVVYSASDDSLTEIKKLIGGE